MKHKKVPLYQINLDIKSNEAKNADNTQEQSNRSSNGGNRADGDSSDAMKFKASTSSVNQYADSAYRAFDRQGSEILAQQSQARDQDTDPKHMD